MLGDEKSVVLSFDDGPAPLAALESILQTLRQEEIKAEFYVLGDEVRQYPEAARMIVDQGHDIQNHSWSHSDLERASEQSVRSELERTQNIIEKTTGITPTKIRPPYGAGGFRGHLDPELVEVARDLSLAIVTWDIDTEDWKTPQGLGPEKINNIESQFEQQPRRESFSILMHVQAGTARDLPAFISRLREWGFTIAEP
ncbi:Peptidoglycan/xylan/chitin deacetylase, PgdA/CDA1 family [Nitrosospira sp. Nsp11]|uniref:polysaccharide deacetylase family protein n=1 Tax=Nitrosospira sp. Nsp11 TaxID=1855338 RepID=UPI000910AD73|nr:polysaccharide deacetylase family protein [Nitrosospira sp. Nsp11]SHL64637.1 Peptidoglycan/xylan/chitin deacetylase, PgdA/CDA1 family [Nitrosospira sp. Nsp11]